MTSDKELERIVNKQFEMIGEKITFSDLPEDGLVEVKKKFIPWYHHYKFRDEEQYEQWRTWARGELGNEDDKELNKIDLLYGLSFKYRPQKGQLELL